MIYLMAITLVYWLEFVTRNVLDPIHTHTYLSLPSFLPEIAQVELSSLSLLSALAKNSTTNCPVNPEAPKIT